MRLGYIVLNRDGPLGHGAGANGFREPFRPGCFDLIEEPIAGLLARKKVGNDPKTSPLRRAAPQVRPRDHLG